MSEGKRYSLVDKDIYGPVADLRMEQDDKDGDWVKYESYDALLDEAIWAMDEIKRLVWIIGDKHPDYTRDARYQRARAFLDRPEVRNYQARKGARL